MPIWFETQLSAVPEVLRDPASLVGIPLALLGAVCLSLGALYQHRGVGKVERLSGSGAGKGLSVRHLRALATRPSWIVGTLLLGLAVVAQLTAIAIAPLMVVQPIGVVALLVTTILNARTSGKLPTLGSWLSIAACVGGIGVFVVVAARFATKRMIADKEVLAVLSFVGVVAAVLVGVWVLARRVLPALFYVLAAGVLYGFVATLAKIILDRIQNGRFDELVVCSAVVLATLAIVGGYFVQSAYGSGPPDLVIAGLTVIDPLIVVMIAMIAFGESTTAPLWALVTFVVAGVVAAAGVVGLARHHPEVKDTSDRPDVSAPSEGR